MRSRKVETFADPLRDALAERLIGQPDALEAILPVVHMFRAGLSLENRPAGVVMLLGPTGTGKTYTAEALAEVLHGSDRNVLCIDCGEYQMEHEVAKLIGAPPGYLGHKETTPLLNQQKLNTAASDRCPISIVVFDEVEKAASSFGRLLLGILDKGTLNLGDNTTVDFGRSIIFLTSNLGAREIHAAASRGEVGFQRGPAEEQSFHPIAMAALRRHFSPEFVNRLDKVVVFRELSRKDLRVILRQQLAYLQRHIARRLGQRSFAATLTDRAEEYILDLGVMPGCGARELKRVIQREVLEPLAAQIWRTAGVAPESHCRVDCVKKRLTFSWMASA